MNDTERLEAVFKAYGDDIAAFLIEPIMGNCCSISATREFPGRRGRSATNTASC
jgi:glutamate-1-semialdehyde 2,1-aminomutase